MRSVSRILMLLMVGLAAACYKPAEQTEVVRAPTTGAPAAEGAVAAQHGAAKGPQTEQPLKLAFVTNNTSDFWTLARRGVEDAQTSFSGVTVDFRMPADGTVASQQQILDDLLVKGFQGIALSPIDPINQAAALADVAKRVFLVTQDSDSTASQRACYVGSNNVDAGRMAGEALKQALPQGGKVMLFVGFKDAQNARERIQGLQEAIQGTAIQIVDIRTDETDRTRAKTNVADALVAAPDLAGLVGLWSYNGPAILNAVNESGNTSVKIVCFDEENETLAGVASGRIHATVVQQPYEFGYRSVELMTRALREGRGTVPANGLLYIPTRAITQANVAEFRAYMDTMRGNQAQ